VPARLREALNINSNHA